MTKYLAQMACAGLLLGIGLAWLLAAPVSAEEPPAKKASPFADPPGAVRLSPKHAVWLDRKRKQVLVDGEVCLREGMLEMFACPKGSKEHESIVAVHSDAKSVHAALLAAGAEVGRPVQWDPVYRPASGTEIEIVVHWYDKGGKRQKARAQEWIRNSETRKAMQYTWVFAGSGFWTDEANGRRYYQADAGDFICVSNFPSATLDLPVESTQADDELLFEAFTEKIPPRGTNVRLVLTPKPKQIDKPSPKRP